MPTDENFRYVHNKQHQHEIDSIVFEPVQRLSPAHFQPAFQAVFAFVKLSKENEFRDPQLW